MPELATPARYRLGLLCPLCGGEVVRVGGRLEADGTVTTEAECASGHRPDVAELRRGLVGEAAKRG